MQVIKFWWGKYLVDTYAGMTRPKSLTGDYLTVVGIEKF